MEENPGPLDKLEHKVLKAIEGVRVNMSSNHDELKEDNKVIKGKLRWIVAWCEKLFRMKE